MPWPPASPHRAQGGQLPGGSQHGAPLCPASRTLPGPESAEPLSAAITQAPLPFLGAGTSLLQLPPLLLLFSPIRSWHFLPFCMGFAVSSYMLCLLACCLYPLQIRSTFEQKPCRPCTPGAPGQHRHREALRQV